MEAGHLGARFSFFGSLFCTCFASHKLRERRSMLVSAMADVKASIGADGESAITGEAA